MVNLLRRVVDWFRLPAPRPLPEPVAWPSDSGEVARLRRVEAVQRQLRRRGYGLQAAAEAIVNYEIVTRALKLKVGELEEEIEQLRGRSWLGT